MRHIATTLIALAVVLTGCATTSAPSVPPYSGTDQITEASSDAFLGEWDLTILNPRKGQETNPTTVTYNANGLFTGLISPTGQSASILGNDKLGMTGSWSVAGGLLRHESVEVSSSGDNAVASFMASLMNNVSQDIGGTANIYELSNSHIVLVGEDGVATRYDRR